MKKKLIVSFHDFHQKSHELYFQFYESLKVLGIHRISILAVPKMHYQEDLSNNKEASNWLLEMQKRGNDICLHGLYHKVISVKGGIISQLIGNIYTDREGEFLNIDAKNARQRILDGLEVLKRIGIYPLGFTPPAWLISKECIKELKNLGFHYLTTYHGILLLQNNKFIKAPVLVWSTRGKLRKKISKIWIKITKYFFSNSDILRLAIHPSDLMHNDIKNQILDCLCDISEQREPMTYSDLIEAD